ncbi:hypothetical protein HU200_047751 [Digitaria exilis]|uniref:DUF1618 domain-containing protein n=1 Tax=Digitaria exilis TaxID=1010633 RepID=A0A835AWL5_9POAL|nr:hypothetical protein HU200_047751 [Digitaria exilis]
MSPQPCSTRPNLPSFRVERYLTADQTAARRHAEQLKWQQESSRPPTSPNLTLTNRNHRTLPWRRRRQRKTILTGIPNVVKDEEAKRTFPPGTDISVAYNELPSASVLTSPPYPYNNYPNIAAADPSGLLLLRAKHPFGEFSAKVTYHLCDARTGEVISLCKHRCLMGSHGDNVGLIMRGDRCLVAELQPKIDGTGRATLLCYSVGEYRWVETELAYSPPLRRQRYWFGHGVISHGGMLWWVDLSYGLLACDPFADEPELMHVPLPRVLDELPVKPMNHSAYCCVKVSGGRLRYVQIHGSPDSPVVSTWALSDPVSAGEWVPERRVCLAEIWGGESYLETMLPRSMPSLALLHPVDPDKVYFFLGSSIFAVDLQRKMVAEFTEFGMPDLPFGRMASSHFVHAWQYDPSRSRMYLHYLIFLIAALFI